MLSILFMTAFCTTDPVVSVKGEKTDLYAWAVTGPGTNPETNKHVPARIDAVASVKAGEDDQKAQSYRDALEGAKNAAALTREVSVGNGEKKFTISNFTTKGSNALLKFWKTGETLAKKVLTCVIDLTSVGKNSTLVDSAEKVSAGWLDYFWKLWNSKDETFKKADLSKTTIENIDTFVKAADAGGTGDAFRAIKGLVPRHHKGLSEKEISDAKLKEIHFLVPALMRMKNMGIDVFKITQKFHSKIWALLGEPKTETTEALPGPLDIAKPGTLEAFAGDDTPSQLQLDFWKVFWDDTMIKIVTDQLTQEQADQLADNNLNKLNDLAEAYKIS